MDYGVQRNEHWVIDPMLDVGVEDFIGSSPAAESVRGQLESVSRHMDATVAIVGETGTGKDLVARILHAMSRTQGAFAVFDCSSLPETLVAAELFGAERGAFTGAYARKVGRVEEASKGTLFLDEVVDFPLRLQPTLLRLLESRRFRRLGGNSDLPFHARVVVAARNPLANEVKAGRFRDDLFYRLSVVEIHLPPLRERREDILMIAEMFLDQLCERYGRVKHILKIPDIKRLLDYTFPGNIRELRNIIERSIIMTPPKSPLLELSLPVPQWRDLSQEKSPSEEMGKGGEETSPETLEVIEKRHVEKTLRYLKGNVSRTAASLSISRPALMRRLEQWPELKQLTRELRAYVS